jgi:hypothetical protein
VEVVRKQPKNTPLPRALSNLPKDEVLVSDVRAGVTPAEMVEHKLVGLLKNIPLPLSRLQAKAAPRPGM